MIEIHKYSEKRRVPEAVRISTFPFLFLVLKQLKIILSLDSTWILRLVKILTLKHFELKLQQEKGEIRYIYRRDRAEEIKIEKR